MRKILIQFLLMLTVIVYLKDGEVLYFNDANHFYVSNSGGAWGARALYLEIYPEANSFPKDRIASFNWGVVHHVEKK